MACGTRSRTINDSKKNLAKRAAESVCSQFSRGMGFMSYIIETIIDEDYILLWFKRLLWMV